MDIERIHVENFRPFSDETVEFDAGTTVIHGVNGAGKSSLLDAIFFALYGSESLSSNETLEDLIMNGRSSATVELTFSVHGESQEEMNYIVTRELTTSSSGAKTASCILKWDDESISGVRNVESEIEQLVGLNAESYLNCAYIRQGEVTRLLEATPDERASMIDELLQLGKLDTYSERADNARRGVKRVKREVGNRVETLESQLGDADSEEINQQIESIEHRVSVVNGYRDELESVSEDLESSISNLESFVESIVDFESSYHTCTTELSNVASETISLNGEISDLYETLEALTSKRVSLKNECDDILSELVTDIDSFDDMVAPYDGRSFRKREQTQKIHDVHSEIETYIDEITDDINSIETQLNTVESNIKSKSTEMDNASNEISNKQNRASEMRSEMETDIADIKRNMISIGDILTEIRNTQSEYVECVENIKNLIDVLQKLENGSIEDDMSLPIESSSTTYSISYGEFEDRILNESPTKFSDEDIVGNISNNIPKGGESDVVNINTSYGKSDSTPVTEIPNMESSVIESTIDLVSEFKNSHTSVLDETESAYRERYSNISQIQKALDSKSCPVCGNELEMEIVSDDRLQRILNSAPSFGEIESTIHEESVYHMTSDPVGELFTNDDIQYVDSVIEDSDAHIDSLISVDDLRDINSLYKSVHNDLRMKYVLDSLSAECDELTHIHETQERNIKTYSNTVGEFVDLYTDYFDKYTSVDELENDIGQLENDIETLNSEIESLESKKSRLIESKSVLESELSYAQEMETEYRSAVAIVDEVKELSMDVDECISEINSCIQNRSQYHDKWETNIQTLTDMVESFSNMEVNLPECIDDDIENSIDVTISIDDELVDAVVSCDVEDIDADVVEIVQKLRERSDSVHTVDVDRVRGIIDKLNEELSDTRERIRSMESHVEDMQSNHGRMMERYDTISDLESQIESVKKKHTELIEFYTEVENNISVYDDIRYELREQNVGALEAMVNEMFETIYQHQSYSHINLTNEYEIEIVQRNGETLRPMMLSGGEKVLFNLSLRCAIYKLLAETTSSDSLPPLVLDEPTAQLDDEHIDQLSNVVDAVVEMGVNQTIVVSHQPKVIDDADNDIEVITQGGSNKSEIKRDEVRAENLF